MYLSSTYLPRLILVLVSVSNPYRTHKPFHFTLTTSVLAFLVTFSTSTYTHSRSPTFRSTLNNFQTSLICTVLYCFVACPLSSLYGEQIFYCDHLGQLIYPNSSILFFPLNYPFCYLTPNLYPTQNLRIHEGLTL